MIKVQFYTHQADDEITIELSDIGVTHISDDVLFIAEELPLIFECLFDGLQDLHPEKWHEAEVKREFQYITNGKEEYFVIVEVSQMAEDLFGPDGPIHYNNEDIKEILG